MKRLGKYGLWALVLVALVLGFRRLFQPSPLLVDLAKVEQGTLQRTVEEIGRTRLRERYTIAAPVAGTLVRAPLQAGAQVKAGETILATFVPSAPASLDSRARAEAEARVQRAQAMLGETRAMELKAHSAAQFAEAEWQRQKALEGSGAQSAQELDRARRDAQLADADWKAAQSAVQVTQYELEMAQAALLGPETEGGATSLHLRSPIDGRVIRVFEDSERPVAAGTPLMEVGDVRRIELVGEFLSQDAVAIEAGMTAEVNGWQPDGALSREDRLQARVRLVEPGGFTKVSALGVEEQRVNVLFDPEPPLEAWARLGDAYRVELRVIVEQVPDCTLVPTGALFRRQGGWHVFAVHDGQAKLQKVQIGRGNGIQEEVLEGLEPGDQVVLYPSELVEDGRKVQG
ncbi:MAG: HlyD family efflux transporter periplasmic adaptor subunit [Planctomycetota bacterium]